MTAGPVWWTTPLTVTTAPVAVWPVADAHRPSRHPVADGLVEERIVVGRVDRGRRAIRRSDRQVRKVTVEVGEERHHRRRDRLIGDRVGAQHEVAEAYQRHRDRNAGREDHRCAGIEGQQRASVDPARGRRFGRLPTGAGGVLGHIVGDAPAAAEKTPGSRGKLGSTRAEPAGGRTDRAADRHLGRLVADGELAVALGDVDALLGSGRGRSGHRTSEDQTACTSEIAAMSWNTCRATRSYALAQQDSAGASPARGRSVLGGNRRTWARACRWIGGATRIGPAVSHGTRMRCVRLPDVWLWVEGHCLDTLCALAIEHRRPEAAQWIADLEAPATRTGMRARHSRLRPPRPSRRPDSGRRCPRPCRRSRQPGGPPRRLTAVRRSP
jgi:hypothetical protein